MGKSKYVDDGPALPKPVRGSNDGDGSTNKVKLLFLQFCGLLVCENWLFGPIMVKCIMNSQYQSTKIIFSVRDILICALKIKTKWFICDVVDRLCAKEEKRDSRSLEENHSPLSFH